MPKHHASSMPLRPRPMIVALAMLFATPLLHARELPPVDALAAKAPRPASMPVPGSASDPAARGERGRVEDAIGRSLGTSVRVSLQDRLGVPAFLAVTRSAGGAGDGTAGMALSPEGAARGYLEKLAPYYSFNGQEARGMPLRYTQRTDGGGSLVRFRNELGGVPVFREEMTLLLDARNTLLAVSGYAGALKAQGAFSLGARDVLSRALSEHGFDAAAVLSAVTESPVGEGGYVRFDLPDSVLAGDGSHFVSARARKTYFRLPKNLVPAYYLETEVAGAQDSDAHGWVISAVDGSVLFRVNLQAHAHQYRVWAEAGSGLPLPSVTGRDAVPFPDEPRSYVPSAIAPTLVTPTELDPWLPLGATETLGNNVDAYADRSGGDGFDASDLRANVTSPGVFDRTHDLTIAPNANDDQIKASVTSLFYVNNFLHDWFYGAGFNEAAGNAQQDNYGRGGIQGDRMRAEAQDYSGTNNANMQTPADGASPRMQMYLFTGPIQASVTAGAPLNKSYNVGGAAFGPQSFGPLAGDWVNASPANGCAALTNVPPVTGKIVLIDRGDCTYESKVKRAQEAGATAVLIVNYENKATTMGDDALSSGVTIPSLMVASSDGAEIRANVGASLTLSRSATQIAVDGTLDNTVVAHEWAHYLSNRLVGDSAGLSTVQSRGMGEGWSDFVSLLMTVKAEDVADFNNDQFQGAYAVGADAVQGLEQGRAYYQGIRRYPYSTELAVNPLTFGNISNDYPLVDNPASDNPEVHNTGEVWASMLWECYAGLLRDTQGATPRIASFDEAQDRMKRYLVAGLKLTPNAPTFTEARDALLMAIAEQNGDDAAVCAAAFAKRGAGVLAVSPDRYSTNNTGVVPSTEPGGDVSIVSVTLDDSLQSVDSDGYLDGGERGRLRIRYANTYAVPLTGLSLSVSSSSPVLSLIGVSGAIALPPLAPYQEAEVVVEASLSSGISGIQELPLEVAISGASLAVSGQTRNFSTLARAHVDEIPLASRMERVETRTPVWGTGGSLAGVQWRIQRDGATLNQVFHGPDEGAAGLTVLESPDLQVSATEALRVFFRHRHSFEADLTDNWDGGTLEISEDSGVTWTDLSLAIYNGAITSVVAENPYQGFPAFVGQNASYPAYDQVTADAGNTYAGKTVRLRFVVATDMSTGEYGWDVDDVVISGITNTPFTCVVGHGLSCGGLAPYAGDGQRAALGSAFTNPLVAQTTGGDGSPMAGIPVVFTVLPSVDGAGATFLGGLSTVTVISDAQGLAQAPVLTASGGVGAFSVSAVADSANGFAGGSHVFGLSNHSVPVSNGAGTSAIITGGGANCAFVSPTFVPLTGAAGSPPSGSAPAGFAFPYGLFDFTLANCTAPARIELKYPAPLPAGSAYWKYGRTAAQSELHWYRLTEADNQLTITGDTVSFTLADGGWGDDDTQVNGSIMDQGGVGVPAAAPPEAGPTPVPLLAPWLAALLAAGVGGMGARRLRRRD